MARDDQRKTIENAKARGRKILEDEKKRLYSLQGGRQRNGIGRLAMPFHAQTRVQSLVFIPNTARSC